MFDFLTTPDNRSIRYGVWKSESRRSRGTVLFLSGRVEFMEKHAETIGELSRKGFDVFSLDWRGQGLSSRELRNRHKGYIRDYTDYVKDLALFIHRVITPYHVRPLVALSHSMGGHILLRFLHDVPNIIDKAVLVAPMVDIGTFPFPVSLARLITRTAMKLGKAKEYAVGSGDYVKRKFPGNVLTSDPRRFSDEAEAIEQNPDLAVGGVTYGWLAATFESIDLLTDSRYAAEIKTPALILSGKNEKVVSVKAQISLCHSMPDCRMKIIPNARHEILKEKDIIRSIFWKEFDKFVSESKGKPCSQNSNWNDMRTFCCGA